MTEAAISTPLARLTAGPRPTFEDDAQTGAKVLRLLVSQVADDLDRRPLAGRRPGPPGGLVQLAHQQLEHLREARQLAARVAQQATGIGHPGLLAGSAHR